MARHRVELGSVELWTFPLREFDLSGLCHPLWWLTLAVLAMNDHVLKGAAGVPGWLTGKLSDFAFLVVAPVLAQALLPTRLPYRRTAAFLLTVGPFVAANLSPWVSDTLIRTLALVGIRWRLWPDPSDLVALAVAPLSWQIAAGRRWRICIPSRRLVELAGMTVGAAACIATSYAPPKNYHEVFPFFVNATSEARTVTFTWILRKTSCQANLSELAAALTNEDLDDPRSSTFSAGQVAALDVPPHAGDPIAGVCRNWETTYVVSADDCATLLVGVTGGPTVLVAAERYLGGTTSAAPICEPVMAASSEFPPEALVLVEEAGQPLFRTGARLRSVVVDPAAIAARPAATAGCRSLRDQIHGQLSGAMTCSTFSDCQYFTAGIPIPGDADCNGYANLTFSADTLTQARAQWSQQCASVVVFTCPETDAAPSATCTNGRCTAP